MYLIIFNGLEMKAISKKSIQTWFKRNRLVVEIDWMKLRKKGEVVSSCANWYICKIDGRQYKDTYWMDRYGWIEKVGKIYRKLTAYERKYGL